MELKIFIQEVKKTHLSTVCESALSKGQAKSFTKLKESFLTVVSLECLGLLTMIV